jgi:hypothetical protein
MNPAGAVNRAVYLLHLVWLLIREASAETVPKDAGHGASSASWADEEKYFGHDQ